MAKEDAIKVAVEVSRGIAVQAKGNPAKVVAYGAAAAIAFVGIAVGIGTYNGGKKAIGWAKKKYS